MEMLEPVNLDAFSDPIPLARRGMGLPAAPGVYVVSCGDCLAHIGISGSLRARVGTLAALGTHRGSAEVLCAAYCTGKAPGVRWRPLPRDEAGRLEVALKATYGEPPIPRQSYAGCVNGKRLLADIVSAAGPETWEAGYAEAVFSIGEKLSLLFAPRFAKVWDAIGTPPGPWAA